MSVNKVFLVGNIGIISELKESKEGLKHVNFSLATNEKSKGETVTEWHNVVAFGKLAENISTYCQKGKKIFVSGKIQSSKYKDKEGNDKTAYKIVCNDVDFLSPAEKQETLPLAEPKEYKPVAQNAFIDDEIPF